MNRLPSPEEQQWLTHALKKLVAKRGIEFLDAAPLIEPTNDWFPEPWSETAAHGHRLAQRLLYYAGLGMLRPTLSAYEPHLNDHGSAPWDAGTAGWFAGIKDKRAHFGLHVRQFSDPEAAAGVLAHEVAHAWRTHHRLTNDDRDKEELLTDLTTIALGFGILTTNNTDRYRSSGTWRTTAWSISSVGYLPPQAMAFALALWCAAREQDETRTIERHLEPNQRSYFRAALEELDRGERSPRELLTTGAPTRPFGIVRPDAFTPDDPNDDEVDEPPPLLPRQWNEGKVVYRIPHFLRRDTCSECRTSLDARAVLCPECGGTIGPRVGMRELRRIREEQLEQRALRDTLYEECDECAPEHPCANHADEPLPPDDGPLQLPKAPAIGVVKYLGMLAAAALVVAAGVAWWRQNHVEVYFDNAVGHALTLQLDGETIPFAGRLSVRRALAPGRHEIVVRDGDRELERLNPVIRKQSLVDALLAPHINVYNAAGAGIYERQKLGYSSLEIERTVDSTLIGLTRWIDAEPADYLFTEPPQALDTKGTRTVFHIPRGVGYRELAWTWFYQDRVDDAARALQKGLATDTCNEDLRSDLADLYESAGQHDRAIAAASAWTHTCDGSIDAHRVYQNLLLAAHRDELRASYLQRLRANGSAANHYLYGRLLRGEAAMREYREAIRLDPTLAWPQTALAHELLIAERDAEAFALIEPNAERDPELYAMAAVATKQIDRANEHLRQLDPQGSWNARWILARAKEDWDQAKVLLAELEHGEPTPRTRKLRAQLDWESRTHPLTDITDVLRANDAKVAADVLELQDAFVEGRFSEAALKGAVPDLDKVYAAEAAILAGEPVSVKITEPLPSALLDAALGRIDEKTLLDREDVEDLRAHAWFALAVHAASTGDRARAAQLFRHAADRALDRDTPYRLAVAMARRFGGS